MREPTEYKGPPIQRSWRFAILRIRRLPSQASSSLLFPPRREMFHSSHGYGDVSKSRVHISIVSRRGRPLATDTVKKHLEHPGKPETDACFKVEKL
ncbi:hypothetical protein MA16_Dca029123 [Dendrobium catenatum]|uniref:Uncharacterized protein n=1 Tax=Dendrobium catenatum TaxID=906689 RepID=A0A2I0VAK9_9ASPA|nr:hypothetical protein MA16_Dca029123 [Dendrobium catenatum]